MVDHLLEGLLTWSNVGLPSALPTMRFALAGLSSTADPTAVARWAWLAYHMVKGAWQDDLWFATTERCQNSVRSVGALSFLPGALVGSANFALAIGEFSTASNLLADALDISAAVGLTTNAGIIMAALSAWRGDRSATEAFVERVARDGAVNGYDETRILADYCTAILSNGIGDHRSALPAARASAYGERPGHPELGLPEIVEAAVRLGEREEAERALELLAARTTAAGTSWALGVEAYCRALLRHGDAAETLYLQGIAHLDNCRILPFRLRARLLFGEWLRREHRRVEAREHLLIAYEGFAAMGALGFTERARRELVATGGTVTRRTEKILEELTPQELQVARLAAADASNHEIAAQLFISPSTVGYHLGKAFRKLDINSRRQLKDALGGHLPQSDGPQRSSS